MLYTMLAKESLEENHRHEKCKFKKNIKIKCFACSKMLIFFLLFFPLFTKKQFKILIKMHYSCRLIKKVKINIIAFVVMTTIIKIKKLE